MIDVASAKTKKAIRASSQHLSKDIDAAAAKAARIKQRLVHKAIAAKNRAQEQYQEKKDQGESYIRKNPWRTLGIAALAGFIAAKIFRRRK